MPQPPVKLQVDPMLDKQKYDVTVKRDAQDVRR